MRMLRAFLSFWYDFIVGDDATIAVGVVVALAATAILASLHVPAWWLLPVAVVVLLGLSLRRASRG
jgi:large-conductance mechanosensitive channel